MQVVNLPANSVRPAPWRTTYVLKPDLKLLARSMTDAGWLQPIVVRKADMTIIDGFHRWLVATQDKWFGKRHDTSHVPCVVLDIDEIDAMILHVRMNRARGAVVAKFLSSLVMDVLVSKKYNDDELCEMLEMSDDEIIVLREGSLLKHRKIKEYEYSKAWIPVEVPAGTVTQTAAIERPPNSDR